MSTPDSSNHGESTTSVPVRLLFGLLLAVYAVVIGLFKMMTSIFGFWVIAGINLGIIAVAYWLNPTLGTIVAYIVFGYWALWLLLKVIQLVGGKRLEQAITAKLNTFAAKGPRA
jgi:hypothetical protein